MLIGDRARHALGVVVTVIGAVSTVLLGSSGPAAATWSIAATDPETGQIGAAIASCVPVAVLGDESKPLVPIVLVPGEAVAVTQAALNLDAPARIRELVAADATPAEIVDDLMSPLFDEVAALRQHAVVRLDGEAAAGSGAETLPVAAAETATAVSVQGNLLVSEAVVTDTLGRYQAARGAGADLATGLVEGLLAGSQAGGDRRCEEQTALFAQIVVAEPGDAPDAPSTLLTVSVDEGDGHNPVVVLAEAHQAGRSGVIDAGTAPAGSGRVVRTVVLALALVAIVVAAAVFRRGLGSVAARR